VGKHGARSRNTFSAWVLNHKRITKSLYVQKPQRENVFSGRAPSTGPVSDALETSRIDVGCTQRLGFFRHTFFREAGLCPTSEESTGWAVTPIGKVRTHTLLANVNRTTNSFLVQTSLRAARASLV
jgi:hypothetical protein